MLITCVEEMTFVQGTIYVVQTSEFRGSVDKQGKPRRNNV